MKWKSVLILLGMGSVGVLEGMEERGANKTPPPPPPASEEPIMLIFQ